MSLFGQYVLQYFFDDWMSFKVLVQNKLVMKLYMYLKWVFPIITDFLVAIWNLLFSSVHTECISKWIYHDIWSSTVFNTKTFLIYLFHFVLYVFMMPTEVIFMTISHHPIIEINNVMINTTQIQDSSELQLYRHKTYRTWNRQMVDISCRF